MKGRGNYLCLHRFDALKDSAAIHSRDEAIAIECIDEWVAQTETGDRAEMDDLPEDFPLWPDIAATSENCIGADCPRFNDCFVTKMRQRAAESDVVIVNHHLLCADASVRQSAFGEVIPSCRYAIVDEAHQLEDVATQYFGTAVSNYRFDDYARDVDRAISAKQIPDRDASDTLRDDIDNVRDGARLFFGTLQMLRFEARERGRRTASASPRRCSSAPLADAAVLVRALEAVEATIALTKDLPEDVHRARPPRRGTEARRPVPDPRRRSRPRLLPRHPRPRRVPARLADRRLRHHPRDAARPDDRDGADLGDAERRRPLRLRPRPARHPPGARDAAAARSSTTREQAILYLPKKMPDPRSPEFVAAAGREVVEILKRTAGAPSCCSPATRTCARCTSSPRPRSTYPILVQGSAPRSALLREFKATPNAVLFATSSFWQGVDVVGESLSCVIIDKLPFASPGDPITSARIEAINADGGNAFAEYQIPLAILALQQGLGPADPPPPGPRRPRRPRPAAADDGLRTTISCIFTPRTCNARPRNDR